MTKKKQHLSVSHPEVAKLWHPTKNGDLTPADVTKGVSIKAWWICSKSEHHDYQMNVSAKALQGQGCPFCAGVRVAIETCLTTKRPDLVEFWNKEKNGELTPFDVFPGSHKKVWWTCPKSPLHDFQMAVQSFTKGERCPYCSGKRVNETNSLKALYPEIAKEWYILKNSRLTPSEVTAYSSKKVWWKCNKGEDHEWLMSIQARTLKQQGCTICRNRKIVKSNCLAQTHAELASEWVYELNMNHTPDNVGAGTNKKFWWQCKVRMEHIWKTSPNARIYNKTGCPYCANRIADKYNNLASKSPELLELWDYSKNEVKPTEVTFGSKKIVWWKCPEASDHRYKMAIYLKTSSGQGCPICRGMQVSPSNSLASKYPELAKEWNNVKNGSLTPFDVSPASGKKVWWQCPQKKDHVYLRKVSYRTTGNDCPICRGMEVIESSSFGYNFPEIAKQWHPTKNKKFTPFDISVGSGKKVWWKCDVAPDHEWQADVIERKRGDGCPACAGYKVVDSNCLATRYPEVTRELHPIKNGRLDPTKTYMRSQKKVWWQCSKDSSHVWMTAIKSRTDVRGVTGCPFCSLLPQSKQELTILFELKSIFPDINPRGFKTRLEGKIHSMDIYIPNLNLGIEFDGNFWHKDKIDFDKLKSKKIREAGFRLIRIREEPLEKLSTEDIISPLPFNAKKVTDQILWKIQNTYELSEEKVKQIKQFIAQKNLMNEVELNRYVDSVLKNKAQKN